MLYSIAGFYCEKKYLQITRTYLSFLIIVSTTGDNIEDMDARMCARFNFANTFKIMKFTKLKLKIRYKILLYGKPFVVR